MRFTLGHKAHYPFSDAAELEQNEALLSLFGARHQKEAARVGRISSSLMTKIKAQTTIVKVLAITVMKVKGKHTQILYSDLELLQHGFNNGRVQQDTPRSLIFLFRDPRNSARSLKAVVKSTRKGDEVLLSTLHPCTGKCLLRAMKKGEVVRDVPI